MSNHELSDSECSIEDLESDYWGDIPSASYIVRAAHEMRRKPLRDLTLEDIRVGLEQQIGLSFIVPLAIERLSSNPRSEASKYEGDLLENLLNVPSDFWVGNSELRGAAEKVWEAFTYIAPSMGEGWREICYPAIIEAYERFSGVRPSKQRLRKM